MNESHLGFHGYAWFVIELTPQFPWFISFHGNDTPWFKNVNKTALSMVSHQGFHVYDIAWFVCDIMLDHTKSFPGVHSSHPVNMTRL